MSDLTTMEALYNKMGEYTKMDTEIPFGEFQEYFQSIIGYLMANYQDMEKDDLLKAKGICMIVAGNAKMRSLRKDDNRKKYAKMAEKAKFWEDALQLNLVKSGMTPDAIDAAIGGFWA